MTEDFRTSRRDSDHPLLLLTPLLQAMLPDVSSVSMMLVPCEDSAELSAIGLRLGAVSVISTPRSPVALPPNLSSTVIWKWSCTLVSSPVCARWPLVW